MPSTIDTTEGFLRCASVFARLMERLQERAAFEAGAGDFTTSHLNLLKVIDGRGGLAMSSAADFLGVSRPAVSHSAERLVAKGCLRRVPDRGDRRVSHLRLTSRGRRLLEGYCRARRELAARLLGPLGAARLQALANELRVTVLAATAADPSVRDTCLQCIAFDPGVCLGGKDGCPFAANRDGGTGGLV